MAFYMYQEPIMLVDRSIPCGNPWRYAGMDRREEPWNMNFQLRPRFCRGQKPPTTKGKCQSEGQCTNKEQCQAKGECQTKAQGPSQKARPQNVSDQIRQLLIGDTERPGCPFYTRRQTSPTKEDRKSCRADQNSSDGEAVTKKEDTRSKHTEERDSGRAPVMDLDRFMEHVFRVMTGEWEDEDEGDTCEDNSQQAPEKVPEPGTSSDMQSNSSPSDSSKKDETRSNDEQQVPDNKSARCNADCQEESCKEENVINGSDMTSPNQTPMERTNMVTEGAAVEEPQLEEEPQLVEELQLVEEPQLVTGSGEALIVANNKAAEFQVTCDLGSYKPEDIQVRLSQNTLYINAASDVIIDGETSHHSLQRVTTLPPDVDVNTLRCQLMDIGHVTISADYVTQNKQDDKIITIERVATE